MANTYLTRTASGTDGSNSQRKNTVSMWLKRASLSDACFIEGQGNNANATQAYFDSNANLTINHVSGDSSLNFQIVTNRKFRDISAWYHIVITIETSLGTAADRVKIYVNGVRETSFASASYPGQNATTQLLARLNLNIIGRRQSGGTGLYFDGSMSHIHVTDGTAYDASYFGETDATTGEWKIKTDVSVTYGNNGFFILKDGNSVTDQSGNSNNFTINVGAGGGLNKTEDCPSNVFATLNPLSTLSTLTYAYGNNQITGVNSNVWKTTFSTLGMNYGSSGKYYYEIKVATLNSQAGIGVWGEPLPQTVTTNFFPNHHPFGFVYKEDGSVSDDSQTFYTGSSFTSGDIIQCALDIDNSKIYFGKNGTWQNSGDPTSGATGTGAVPLEDNGGGAYFFFGTCYGTDVEQANFGNGYFANNPVSSAGTNASGNGIFEYDVPTGFTALSTKGLNL